MPIGCVSKFDLKAGASDQVRNISYSASKIDSHQKLLGIDKQFLRNDGVSSKSNPIKEEISSHVGIKSISSTHYQILMAQCKL